MLCFLHLLLRLLRCRLRLLPLAVLYHHSNIRLLYLWKAVICDHVKLLLLTGATAPKIRECVENIEGEHPPIIEVENLETAVQEAAARAESGDVVIMSPASASFDRFKNFMERGKLFKSLVEEL